MLASWSRGLMNMASTQRSFGLSPLAVLDNQQIAAKLDEVAELLEVQEANPFRVRAYRRAAATLRQSNRPIADILVQRGIGGLVAMSGIGQSLARSIEQLAHTGELPLLSQLRGDTAPERLFESVPGIGRELAHRIHEALGIESLADLQIAAYDGRLERLEGIGRGRLRAVRESLAGRFRQSELPPTTASSKRIDEPPVEELLDIDGEYRRKAVRDQLVRIAPRRLNPTRKAWLPILHTHREHRHYTVLFSNTIRAHELGMTKDWVVIYRDDGGGDGQWTVVTGRYGALKSRRIVRGREAECEQYYQAADAGNDGHGHPHPTDPQHSLFECHSPND